MASYPHVVRVLAPFTFEVRPVGFADHEPNFRVQVERAAFALRARVVPDYLAVAIVSAVVAGAENNPARVGTLRDSLIESRWSPSIELTNATFQLHATRPDLSLLDDDEISTLAIEGALQLSEFVIDQLVITRTFGEMRPAVDRPASTDSETDPWLYDPSERDRSTQVHRSLENWLIETIRNRGLEPLDPAGEPFFDVAWIEGETLFVCEVKSTANSEVHQLRLGLGQILQYRQMLERSGWGSVVPILFVEREPADPEWTRICDRVGVRLLWPSVWGSEMA